jgi:hypothetical protein
MTGDGLPTGCVGRKGDQSQWRASLPLTCANPTRDTFLDIERQAQERLGDGPNVRVPILAFGCGRLTKSACLRAPKA